jgi:hypothetical protein
MDMILFVYFCIVFLGLQGLYLFQKETSIMFIMVGNFLIAYHCVSNFMWELLILTFMMFIAQITRIIRGIE